MVNMFTPNKASMDFVLLFSIVSLIPWLAFYVHGQSEGGSEDGPLAVFLLSTTASATIFALLIYSLAIYLVRFIQAVHFLKWGIVALLVVVVLFCFGCAAVWSDFLATGSVIFLCAVLGYVALAVHLIGQIASVIKVKRAQPLK